MTRSKVTGIFLENLVADEKPVLVKMQGFRYLDWEVDESSPEVQEKRRRIDGNVKLFTEACEKRSVISAIHRCEGAPAIEMLSGSRFADVIVTDAATSFKRVFEGSPTHFVKDILEDSECPVIIAPEKFDAIDEIIFTYDGSASCVFAMKQFTYLFPELADKKVTIFHVNENGTWPDDEKALLPYAPITIKIFFFRNK